MLCTVAERAPGKYERGSAPILFASTTANAEFCMPVSIDIVLLVFSENLSRLGTEYPAANPMECVNRTDRRTNTGNGIAPANVAPPAAPPNIMAELFATTPPQIKLTSNTLANGVNRETHRDTFGSFSFTTTPINTGASTTFAVAMHNDLPDTEIVLPTINLVNNGVITEAKTVLHAVRRTLRAL